LFRSESDLCNLCVRWGDDAGVDDGMDTVKSEKATTCGVLEVTSLPCRCFGRGGFFFSVFRLSVTRPACSSSSDLAVSCEDLGVSLMASCTGSKSDCREIDEASVLLPLSVGPGGCTVALGGVP